MMIPRGCGGRRLSPSTIMTPARELAVAVRVDRFAEERDRGVAEAREPAESEPRRHRRDFRGSLELLLRRRFARGADKRTGSARPDSR